MRRHLNTSAREKRTKGMIITVALTMSAWLIFTSAHSYLTSLDLAEVAVVGQAEGDLFANLRPCGKPERSWTQEALQGCVAEFFREHEGRGLRYASASLPAPDGAAREMRNAGVFAEVGERRSPDNVVLDPNLRGRPVPLGDRYVYIMPPHIIVDAPTHVMEFEPLRAHALRREALLTLIAGVLGAVVTVGGALHLLRLAREREEAQRQAKEREQLALLGKMSAVMAHELRNPLAAAKGHSQLMAEMSAPGTRLQRKAEQVVQELVRVEELTNDLLAFVRSGKVNPRPCDPAALVREVAGRTVIATPVNVEAEGAPPTWPLDAHAMERVLINLLRNAAQAQESQEPIRLVVRQQGEELYFAVRDHGPGLKDGVEVFTPFVTTKSAGTGLGLAVSRQSVEAHGGRISLRNHPEGGALAEIYLPRELPAGA
ncbi:MAG: ATP-binding protein [Myxococcota bacterium]